MPALKFKSIGAEKIRGISKELIDELEELLQCPRSYFSLEISQSIYIKDGDFAPGSPIVEVFWFDRGQELQDKAAKIITRYMNSIGHKEIDVIFIGLNKNRYYENGEHF